MDLAGNGEMICQKDLSHAMDIETDQFAIDKFRYICIMAGCDYLSNIPGIGIKKAKQYWQKTRHTDIRLVMLFSLLIYTFIFTNV